MKTKTKWLALAALLLVALLFLLFLRPFSAKKPEQPSEDSTSTWVSDYLEPNKIRVHLTTINSPFGDGGKLVWKTTFEVAGDPSRREGAISTYKSHGSGNGKITVTMDTQTIGGKEFIKAENKQPAVWHAQKQADGSLEIRCPYGGQITTFHFRKED